jgi:hypothetical protein
MLLLVVHVLPTLVREDFVIIEGGVKVILLLFSLVVSPKLRLPRESR